MRIGSLVGNGFGGGGLVDEHQPAFDDVMEWTILLQKMRKRFEIRHPAGLVLHDEVRDLIVAATPFYQI